MSSNFNQAVCLFKGWKVVTVLLGDFSIQTLGVVSLLNIRNFRITFSSPKPVSLHNEDWWVRCKHTWDYLWPTCHSMALRNDPGMFLRLSTPHRFSCHVRTPIAMAELPCPYHMHSLWMRCLKELYNAYNLIELNSYTTDIRGVSDINYL